MAEEGTAGQTEGERNIQAMETRMCGLGRTQGYCSDVQRWDQESQRTGILNMMRDMKNNITCFFRNIGKKRLAKESAPTLINKKGEQASTDVEKAEVTEFFALVFTASPASQVPDCVGRGQGSEIPPTIRAEHV